MGPSHGSKSQKVGGYNQRHDERVSRLNRKLWESWQVAVEVMLESNETS
jgi:hypothetical protein